MITDVILMLDTCHYRNTSGQMVILRCIGPEAFFQEKVVFPFEDWQFCCPSQSRVDIWTHGIMGAELLDSVQADDLRMSVEADLPAWGLAQQNLGT
ncbi:DUF1830 domain-containing protein [Synechococcus sp. J7-Johnson]|nr:DUF1830 domain-containing protein [Synechococcus sp. J7-Johnson]